MSGKSVEERVIRVFADFKKVPPEAITMDTTFAEMGFDSLDGLNRVFELEEEFNLTIPDDRVDDMKSVRQAVEGIGALLEAKAKSTDMNATASDEFRKQQTEVKATAAAEADIPTDAPEKTPAS